MKVNIEVKGEKQLKNKLDSLYKNLMLGAEKGIEEITENTLKKSKDIAPVDLQQRGIMKEATLSEVKKEDTSIAGKVYIDENKAPFAKYVYFGTGIYGRGSGKTEWRVPMSSLQDSNEELMDMYNYPRGKFNLTEKYWIVHGQQPQPYLKEGLQNASQENLSIFNDIIKDYIKKG